MEQKADLQQVMLGYQRNEITEHHIYCRLARLEKSQQNRDVLERIGTDELRHYHAWREHTGQDVTADRWRIGWYFWISRILGLTFGIKMMERGEANAQENYELLDGVVEDVQAMAAEEKDHEAQLVNLLDEERLHYVGSVVLGLNDALVELTGSLAGLTLALQNTRLIALSGLIVGLAASLSMAASQYLSTKEEKNDKEPLKSSVYTGIAYVVTVMALIAPYLVVVNPFISLLCTLGIAVLIIAAFNYYVSVASDRPFKKHFLEMAAVSLGVAALSFVIGYFVRAVLGTDV
jgi:VIT1/CCC1 family predicted Fe2+/Mn2+ transporter